jgi:hypothetical protein
MNIKEIINNVIEKNNSLAKEVELMRKISDPITRFNTALSLINQFGNHPKLIIEFLTIMQLIDSSEINDQYKLEDLIPVFISALEISNDSELLLEFNYFIDHVMDEKYNFKSVIENKMKTIRSNTEEINII